MTERFQSVTEDLDKQVRQQTQQLVQSARLAGVGFLAAGVAHEINNPLHAIATAAEGLEWRLSGQLDHLVEADRAVVKEYIAMMQTESARCREITEKLLDYDPYNRRMAYTYVDGAVRATDYYSELVVKEIGPNRSVVAWRGRFLRRAYWTDAPPPGMDDKSALDFLSGAYRGGLENLKKVLEAGH